MNLLDCTIRDGGYTNNWEFDDEFVVELYRRLNEVPQFEYMEIGYYDEGKEGSKSFQHLDSSRVHQLFGDAKGRLKLAVMVNYGSSEVTVPAGESLIDLVRVCFHKRDVGTVFGFLEKVKEKGYRVAANAMAFEYYDDDEVRALVRECCRVGVDYLYVADSYGSIYPRWLLEKIDVIRSCEGNDGLSLGVHLHDNLSLAMSNYLAVRDRVTLVDTTLNGMGRGAGNLRTEVVVAHLLKEGKLVDDTMLRDLLCLIGNGDPRVCYLISGYFSIHPKYVSHMLMDGPVGVKEVWDKCREIKRRGWGITFEYQKLNWPIVSN